MTDPTTTPTPTEAQEPGDAPDRCGTCEAICDDDLGCECGVECTRPARGGIDPEPAPSPAVSAAAPTNEQQDVRMVIDHETAWDAIEANVYLTPEAKVEVQTILDTLARPLAAVSAAAPDERELGQRVARAILDDRQKRGDAADLDRDVYERGVQYGMSIAARIARTTAAALAARPAPAVNAADADVREALLERVAAAVDAATRLGEGHFAAIESEASRIGIGSRHWSAVVAVDAVLVALGLTVADEGRAEA